MFPIGFKLLSASICVLWYDMSTLIELCTIKVLTVDKSKVLVSLSHISSVPIVLVDGGGTTTKSSGITLKQPVSVFATFI